MQDIIKALSQETSTLLVLMVLGIAVVIGAIIKDLLVKLVKNHIGNGMKNPYFAEGVSKINEELVFLRAKSNANRVYLCQFHNGDVFEANIPRWRVTQTYVSPALGFDEPGELFRNMDVTTIWDLIGTSIGAFKKLPMGFTQLKDKDAVCETECPVGKGVYLCDVENINPQMGRLKAVLYSRGIQAMIFAPVQDKHHHPFGMIALAYCSHEWKEAMEDSEFDPCRLLCTSSDLIFSFADGIKKNTVKRILYDFFRGKK